MKQTLLITLCLIAIGNAWSQGITLLYKGGTFGGWDDPANWIQINTPVGQTPIQRAPTELDDVVFSSSQSGLSSVNIGFPNSSDSIKVGGSTIAGHRCRSIHVSNTDLSLSENDNISTLKLDVYTTNGGFVLIDSGSNFRYGHFELHGGSAELNDMEIINSTFGSLFSHNNWSTIALDSTGKARFVGSTLGGNSFFWSNTTVGELYAENCVFNTTNFIVGDNSSATILNSTIQNDGNNPSMTFHIGKNANFVSSNVNVSSAIVMDFYTSGSVLNGNVTTLMPESSLNFLQEDPANPLPNIINGSVAVNEESTMGISGDVKISGNFENNSSPLVIYPDTAHLFINGLHIFEVGGIKNYGNNLFITNCMWNYCHFNLEFFGNTNSNIFWPMGLPVDTLVINKTGCAKVTSTNSLYVSGQAKIKSGQLVLNPNDTIPYKFVCAGDLNIYQGGGVFLRKDSNGVVANMAVAGAINDYNLTTDSTCAGLSNPYNGNITLYRDVQNGGNHLINIMSASNIGNLNLIGQPGSDFMLGGNLTVNNFNFINPVKLLLGDHNLVVNGNISNYGPDNYFVTNGLGYLQVNNIGNTASVFPVGTASSYTPATLTNLGTADNFNINVQPQVLSGGTTGSPYIAGVVNRTWNINKSTAGAGNVTVTLQWNAGDELSGFTRNTSYISHYTSGAWNNGTLVAANGSNPYSLTRTGITSFSPFAVMSPAGVVPITLLDFNGRYQDKAIALNWSTLTESNIRYFTVEKSNDAVLFRPLTDIPAYGNSQVKRNYNYVDNAILNYINYYRLKMADINGRYFYSKTITVSATTDHIVVVFPNPVKGELFIRLQNGLPELIIRIVDTKGNMVRTLQLKAGVTATSINTKFLGAGVYSIIFKSGKLKETVRFIKE
jgi:hypothetical protein